MPTFIHEGKNKHLKCSICESKFHSNTDLKQHIRRVHEEKKPFQCSMCDTTFPQLSHVTIETLAISNNEDNGHPRLYN